MGTELVIWQSYDEWKAWQRNMLRKSKELSGKVERLKFAAIGVGVGLLVLLLVLGHGVLAIMLALVVIVGGFTHPMFVPRGVWRDYFADLPFLETNLPCPHCNKKINLARSWICGWCKEEYDNVSNMKTVFQGCDNQDCEITDIGGSDRAPKGAQAAIQCPHCAQHVVIDPNLYNEKRCYVSPFFGVARELHDERAPTDPKPTRILETPEARAAREQAKFDADNRAPKTSWFDPKI